MPVKARRAVAARHPAVRLFAARLFAARLFALRLFAARFLAGSVALVCLAGQFSSFAHLLLVHHSVCREHGELVHDEPGVASNGPLRAELAAPPRSGPTLEAAAALALGAHEHEHCAALSERRNRLASWPPATTLPAPPVREVEVVAFAPEWRVFSGIPLVLLAPKNSPPALG